jgi:hypothetical protein
LASADGQDGPLPQEQRIAAPKTYGPQLAKAAGLVASQVVELPQWFQRLPEVVASLPVPLHWNPFDDAPSPAEDHSPDTGRQPAVSAPPSAGQAANPPPDPLSAQTTAAKLDDSWQEPTTLLQSLRELASGGAAGRWAAEVLSQIHALGPAIAGPSDRADAILRRLSELGRDATQMAADVPDHALAGKLRRAGFALARRVDFWQQLVRLHAPPPPEKGDSPHLGEAPFGPFRRAPTEGWSGTVPFFRPLDPERLAKCLAKIDALTGDSAEGRAWRRYLLVDPLRECLSRPPVAEDAQMRQTAQRALARLTQIPLTPEQQQFVAGEPVVALRDELRHWAAEPIGAAVLLHDIERYEATGLPSDSRRLAMDCQYMLDSPVEARRQLAARVDGYYRNANFRMAVSDELLNDLMPARNLEYTQISDTVQGHPTSGNSLMATEAVVRMRPDPKRVRMALEVTGEIASNTTTDAGAARFFNESQSWYVARKPLEIDMKGISLWPAEVEVHNDTQLRGVDTKLGNVPILGAVLAGVAKSQYEQNKPAATHEVEQKIIRQASERVDAEAREQLAGFVAKLNQRVFDPLNSLSLDPQLIDAETTKRRFTMRLRVGGEDQIGSHTPRPLAPLDSLASVQLHESVLNNGLRRLQLEGRTFTIPQLAQHVGKSLNCTPWQTNPENEDVKITFAQQDPVVVRCQGGQVVLTFSMRRLSKAPHRWSNFQVRAFYRPEVNGRSAQLVREGVIHLMGPRLSTGSQIALRGIFSHALSKKTPFELIPKKIVDEPKLKDAAITQFLIEDGWLGLSLGPKPPVAPVAHRPWRTAG